MGLYNLKAGHSVLADLADGAAASGGYPGTGYTGKEYFVNNVSGSSGFDGSDWDNACDEISTAAALWEAYRAGLTTNDQNVRARIYVQGTATAYSALTTAFHYCDVIGIGADPFGNGAGIARIGADSGTSDGCDFTASVRGVNFYNLQFQAGASGYAFRGTNLFRSNFVHCCFASNGSPGGAPAAGVDLDIASGVNWYDCLWQNQSSTANQFTVGMTITGTHFHGCRVQDCFIGGDTGVAIAATVVNGWGSIFQNCYIGQLSETCSIAVNDDATTGHIIYAGCFLQATTGFDLEDTATRIIGCTEANAFSTNN